MQRKIMNLAGVFSASHSKSIFCLGPSGQKLLSGHNAFERWFAPASLTFYLTCLPRQLGLPVLLLAIIGLACCLRRWRSTGTFLLAWFVACYVMLTVSGYKTPRYFYPALLPFAAFAAVAVGLLMKSFRRPRVRTALFAAVAGLCCSVALATSVKHRPDYGPVVVANQDRIARRIVLFNGLRDGDFVFAVRQHLPWRAAVVIRGSKLFYSCTAYPELDFTSYVSSEADVATLLDRYAFHCLVVERENKLDLAQHEMVQTYLSRGDAYRRVATYHLRADPAPSYRDATLDVYEAREAKRRSVDELVIPSPRGNRTVRVNLQRLGVPPTTPQD